MCKYYQEQCNKISKKPLSARLMKNVNRNKLSLITMNSKRELYCTSFFSCANPK